MTNGPIKVQPTPVGPLIANFLRQCGILIGGGATIIALVRNFLGTGDLNEMIAFVSGEQFAVLVAAAIFVASSLGSLWRTIHNEAVKRRLAGQVSDDLAVIQAHGFRRWLIAILASVFVSSCATVPELTPGQAIYGALGVYSSATAGARAYASSPTADPKIVRTFADATRRAEPAVMLGRAWQRCSSAPDSIEILATDARGVRMPCASFDFSAASLRGAALTLRSAAASLGRRK